MKETYIDKNSLLKILTTHNAVDILPPLLIYNIQGDHLEIHDYTTGIKNYLELPITFEKLKRFLEELMKAKLHIIENGVVILGEL